MSYRNNRRLNRIGAYLVENPLAKVVVEGHASSDGDSDYNMDLSTNRASSVKKALIDMGVSASSIMTKSYGEDKPAKSNSNSQGRIDNRRVEVIVMSN